MNITILSYKRAQKRYKTSEPYPAYYSYYENRIYLVKCSEETIEKILTHEILHHIIHKRIGVSAHFAFDNISHIIEKMMF